MSIFNRITAFIKTSAEETASFFVPRKVGSKISYSTTTLQDKRIAAIVPTHKPTQDTYDLIQDLIYYNSNLSVVVVDDHTPTTAEAAYKILEKIAKLAENNSRVTLLKTPEKQLKASALNFGLKYLYAQPSKPNVVVTLDDDVSINRTTIYEMVKALYSHKSIGTVCSTALVKNKHSNLLTRLQSLEYHGFNVTKISDNGFMHGPLVMQGMLSAFRYDAIRDVKGFATDKLIEDYDVTVRVKNAGWKAIIAPKAVAWTNVPEHMGDLWKQRIRWSYGGLIVLRDYWKYGRSIFQDLIGHALFLILFTFVILSLVFEKNEIVPEPVFVTLIGIAAVYLVVGTIFNVLLLLTYRDRDKWDWVIKFSIIPEFIYCNILSLVLIGSYLFFAYNISTHWLVTRVPFLARVQKTGHRVFQTFGYTGAWGTPRSMKGSELI